MKTTYILTQILTLPEKRKIIKTNKIVRFQSGLSPRYFWTKKNEITIGFNENPVEFNLQEYGREIFVSSKTLY
jgi:hypothetical protein